MAGWKNWAALETVTEPDFQGLLQDQVVMRFASAAARDAALGGNVESGMVSYLADTDRYYRARGTTWEPLLGPVAAAWSYASGWADLGAQFQPVRALRAGQLVILQGVAKTTAAVAGAGVDIGYIGGPIRPAQTIVTSGLTGPTAAGRIDVMATGQVQWQGGPIASGDFLSVNLLWVLP